MAATATQAYRGNSGEKELLYSNVMAFETNSQDSSEHNTHEDLSLNAPEHSQSSQANSTRAFSNSASNSFHPPGVQVNGSGTASATPPTSSFDIKLKNGDSEAVINSSHHPDMTNEESVVQHPTSDLRVQASPVGKEQVKQIEQPKQQQDLAHDLELTNGSANGSDVPTERNLSSGLKHLVADEDTMDDSTAHDDSKTSDLADQPIISILNRSVDDAQGELAPTPTAVGSALNDLAIDSTAQMISSSPQPEHALQGFSRSSSRLTRNREDEEGEGRATKRTRTDEEGSQAPEFKVPDIPRTMTEANEDGTDTAKAGNTVLPDRSLPMTKSQNKFLLKGLQNIRRLKDAAAFNHPVDYVALNIPTYPDVIKQPMDLKTMEEKMKKEKYPSVDSYIADFDQVVQNSLNFNGVKHPVSVCGRSIRSALDKQLSNLPGPDVDEPSPMAKKSKKGPVPKANTPARRESRSSIGNAKSPTATSSPQTFALGPQGVPLIRRDSTVTDGRPKREIHPPAPRDLPYANQKPKKKKFQLELRFCQEVLNEIMGRKHSRANFAFMNPVDPVALNIPHYHKIIKKPMDLSTIEKNLAGGQYENAKEFEGDVRLMLSNCYKFNPPTDAVHAMGKDLEGIFDAFWARKKQWIDEHAPTSGPQSPRSSPEPDDDDDEEGDEEEEDQDEPDVTITAMEKKIADMAKAVEQMKKKKASPPVPAKKSIKSGKATKKDVKRNSAPAPAKAEKKGVSKPAKVKKIPIVTYDQKQDISNRINSLPENRMANALTIIRDNMPNLKGVQEDEIELDIDELPNEVLHQLLVFVRKYAPHPSDTPPRTVAPPTTAVSQRPKKNKPMNKDEQDARIKAIRGKLYGFENPGSPEPENEAANETSGDEPESEESEED